MFGAYRRFAVSKLFLHQVEDRNAFEQSVALLTALTFENVVPSHGAPLLNDGKAKLLAALRERGL